MLLPRITLYSLTNSCTCDRTYSVLPGPFSIGAIYVRKSSHFLNQVGGGMLMAGLGSTLAADLGVAATYDKDDTTSLNFGELESLVCLMQETAHPI